MYTETRYMPWGTERYSSGTTPTSYQFTGQRLESALGLYFYGARWSPGSAPGTGDPAAGRFIQADTIVPGGSAFRGEVHPTNLCCGVATRIVVWRGMASTYHRGGSFGGNPGLGAGGSGADFQMGVDHIRARSC